MSNALEGIVVVALEQAVAAPVASCKLADAGARVIKLERPEAISPAAMTASPRGSPPISSGSTGARNPAGSTCGSLMISRWSRR